MSSGSFQDHLDDLWKVYEILRANHLRVSKKKCVFRRLELDKFGFTVRHGSFKPSLSRVDSIMRWQVPNTKQKMESFLGVRCYFPSILEVDSNHSQGTSL
jgi:hypothetical protein